MDKSIENQLLKLLDDIKTKQKLVIAEGIKDKKALAKLGITNVITLSRKPLFAVVEEVASKVKEVVLLVDLDEEGKKIYHSLYVDLQKHGVKINNKLREHLFKTQLRQIEGLASYVSE